MSTESPAVPASPLRALVRWWPLALVLCVLGGAVGFVGGGLLPPTYTAETRVAVGPGDMSAGAIAGFPQATRDMAQDYARWVTQTDVGSQPTAQVSGSPVPESNVISVQAESDQRDSALTAANDAAQQLVTTVNTGRAETTPAKTLEQVRALSEKWAAAKTELDRTQTEFSKVNGNSASSDAQYNRAAAAVTKAQSDEAYLQTQLDAQSEKYKTQIGQSSASADLRVIRPAVIVKDTHNALRQRYAVLGIAVGLLLALVAATAMERRRARRPSE